MHLYAIGPAVKHFSVFTAAANCIQMYRKRQIFKKAITLALNVQTIQNFWDRLFKARRFQFCGLFLANMKIQNPLRELRCYVIQ